MMKNILNHFPREGQTLLGRMAALLEYSSFALSFVKDFLERHALFKDSTAGLSSICKEEGVVPRVRR